MQTKILTKKAALKKNMMSMVSMVIVAAIALSSATYAWFTFVSNPEIKNLDLYVRAAENIYLSPYKDMSKETGDYENELKWFATLEMEHDATGGEPLYPLNNGIKNRQASAFPKELWDLSSIFNTNNPDFFYRLEDDDGTGAFVGFGTVDSFDPFGAEAGKYARFDLWIKSTTAGDIYLDGSVVNGDIVRSYVKAITLNGDDLAMKDDIKAGIVHTVRVGFICGSEVVIWEPNSDGHIGLLYGSIDATGKVVTNAITSVDDDEYGNVGNDQITFDFGATNTSDPQKIKLFGYPVEDEPVKFSVYIWVEGCDVDTQNAVAKSYFQTNLRLGQDADPTTP